MNLAIPHTSTVLLPYFKGDPSCWPQCPPAGVVVSLETTTGVATTHTIPPALCDGLGECGGWSAGVGASPSDPRVFVLASTGLLYAFTPTDFSTPVWVANITNAAAYAVPPLWMPVVSDAAGNVYAAWGDLLVAVDAAGAVMWRFTWPHGGVSESQPAFGSDGVIYAAYVTESAEGQRTGMYLGAF